MFVLLCVVVGHARLAGAQAATGNEVDDATSRSQTLYRAALSAKRAQDPVRALCLMERARAAWPDAAFSFNIAQLQRELGMCAEARQNYRTFLEHEREPARRREAERALAELADCEAPRNEAPPGAKEPRCADWADAALKPAQTPPSAQVAPTDAQPKPSSANTEALSSAPTPANQTRSDAQPLTATQRSEVRDAVPTPAQVARNEAQLGTGASPLVAASAPARRVPAYLPWIFAGAGVVSLGLAGYELTRVAAAERDVERARVWGPEQAERERDGRTAQTLFWVFGGVGALALAGALVLVLIDHNEPQPSAAAPQR